MDRPFLSVQDALLVGMVKEREAPREVVRAACAEYGDDTVIDWCVAFLTGRSRGRTRTALTCRSWWRSPGPNPGGWSAPVDPVNYYWIRVWAARVLLYVWRDDVVDALRVAADPAWRVREHVAG